MADVMFDVGKPVVFEKEVDSVLRWFYHLRRFEFVFVFWCSMHFTGQEFAKAVPDSDVPRNTVLVYGCCKTGSVADAS